MARVTKKTNWTKVAYMAVALIAITILVILSHGIALLHLSPLLESLALACAGTVGGGASVLAYKEPRYIVESPNDKVITAPVFKNPVRSPSLSDPPSPPNTPVEVGPKVILNEEQTKRLSLLFNTPQKQRHDSETDNSQLSPVRFNAD